jgi:hypothetical protein
MGCVQLEVTLTEAVLLQTSHPLRTTGKFVRAVIEDDTGTPVAGSPFVLADEGGGIYRSTSYVPAAIGNYFGEILFYDDAGFTTLSPEVGPVTFQIFVNENETKINTLNDTKLTTARANNLDNLDAAISTRESEADAATRASTNQTEHDATQTQISNLNDIDQAGVQAALTAQGYTTGRAPNLDNLDDTITSRQSEVDAASRAATNQSEHDTTQVAISNLNDPTAAAIADAVWDEALADHTAPGSMGANQNLIDDIEADTSSLNDVKITTVRANNLDNLDDTISSRESEADAATRASTNQTEHDTTQSAISALNNPSAAQIADAVWDEALADHTTAGSMGANQNLIDDIEADTASLNDTKITTARANNLDNLDTTVSSREAETDAASRASNNQTEHDATQSAISNLNDPTAAAIADAVWDEALADHVAPGSMGANQNLIDDIEADTASLNDTKITTSRANALDNLDATISSREAETDAASRASTNQTEHDATQTAIGNLNDLSSLDIQSALTAQGYTPPRAAALDLLDAAVSTRATQASVNVIDGIVDDILEDTGTTIPAQISALNDPTALEIADAVWDEPRTGHAIIGTFGEFIDASISSRASQTSVDNIQNNTNFQATIPDQVERPTSGTVTITIFARLFDNLGVPKDPDLNTMNITIQDQGGGGIIPLTAMTRTGVGRFEYDYVVTTSSPLGQQVIFFDYDESAVGVQQIRTLTMAETANTLDQIALDAADIKAQTDQILFDGNSYVRSVAEIVNDKTDYTLTAADKQAIVDGGLNEVISDYTVPGSVGFGFNYQVYAGAVWVNTTAGAPGTDVGIHGIPSNPSNNFADALALANSLNLRKFILLEGTFTLSGALPNYEIEIRDAGIVNFGGQNVDGSLVRGGTVTGTMSGEITLVETVLDDVVDFLGTAVRCGLDGTTQLGAGQSTMQSCYSKVPGNGRPVIDFVVAGRTLNMRAYSGGLRVVNMTDASNLATVEFIAGKIDLPASNTDGEISIRGTVVIDDQSVGLTVDQTAAICVAKIVDNTWDEPRADHTLAGSFGEGAQGVLSIARADNLDNLDDTISSRQSEVDAASRASTNQTEHDATQAAIAALENASLTDIADAVWDEALADHLAPGSMGANQNLIDDIESDTSTLNDTKITTARANNLDFLDVAVSSREAETDAANRAATDQAEHDATQLAISNLNDPTAAAIADAVWDEALVDHNTPGSMGANQNLIDDIESDTSTLNDTKITTARANNLDRLDATISSRQSELDAANRAATDVAEHNATQSAIAALENASLGDIADAVWDEALAGHTIAGSAGFAQNQIDDILADTASLDNVKLTTARANALDNLDVAVSTRESEVDAAARAFADQNSHSQTQTDIANLNDPTVDQIVDGVWDESLLAHQIAGSAGRVLSDISAININSLAQAVWDEDVLGNTNPGTFGSYVDVIRNTVLSSANDLNDGATGLVAIFNEIGNEHGLTRSEININEAKIDNLSSQLSGTESDLTAEILTNRSQIGNLSTQLGTAESNIISEVDQNETKIDTVNQNILTIQNNTTTRFVVPTRLIRPTVGTKDYEFHLRLYNTQGQAEAPDAAPTIEILRLDTGAVLDSGTMTQIGAEVGAYRYQLTLTPSSPDVPVLVEARVVENGEARLVPATSEITDFESDLTALDAKVDAVDLKVTDSNTLLNSGVFGLQALRNNHDVIVNEINANETKIDAIKAKTDNLPNDPASATQVAAVNATVLTRPTLVQIQNALNTLEDALRGPDNRNLTEVYDVFDVSGLLTDTDPRLDNLDAAISSRSTLTAAQVWAHVNRTLTALTIPAAEIDKIWDYLTSQATTPNSIGKLIVDFLDVAVSSRASTTDVTGPLAGVAQEATLTAFAGATATRFTDVDNDNAAIKADTAAIKAKTDNLPSDPASQGAVNARFTSVDNDLTNALAELALIKAKTDNLPADPASNTEVNQIPTNPLLTTDPRLNNLDAAVSSRATPADLDVSALVTSVEYQSGKTQIIDEINDNEAKIDSILTNLLAVKASTDNLPANPASEATLTQGITDIRDDISNIPGGGGGGLTAADVWSFANRELTTNPDTFKADVSNLATQTDVQNIPANYDVKTSTTLDSVSDQQQVIVWLEKNGARVPGATNCTITIKDAAGATVWTQTQAASNAEGVFTFTEGSVTTLVNNRNYYISVTVEDGGTPVSSNTAFFTVQ